MLFIFFKCNFEIKKKEKVSERWPTCEWSVNFEIMKNVPPIRLFPLNPPFFYFSQAEGDCLWPECVVASMRRCVRIEKSGR